MKKKKIINTADAPLPIGPYNQAVYIDKTLYISGQICIDPQTGQLRNQNVQDETHRVMQNLGAILKEADMTFENVVKTTIFLTDMNQFAAVNEIYSKYFDCDPALGKSTYPARETVQVSALPRFVNVEISMIAHK